MQPIAVIGMSCLFPGAKNTKEFWENLIQGINSCTSATPSDLEVEVAKYLSEKKGETDKFYSTRGGYINEFSLESEGFLLSRELIEKLGESFQWSLHVAREALLDGGYIDKKEILKNCGVILGNLSFPTKASNHLILPFYQNVLEPHLKKILNHSEFSLSSFARKKDFANENLSISGLPASFIAKGLGLSAYNLALDAACASSLYAVAIACYYLQTGKTDLMLAGAVSAADPFFVNMGFSIFHAYPEQSENFAPLDKKSGGLYASQGAGMFLLKRLCDAERDGDRIHAVISGIGLSNDGRGQFILSPNSKGQVKAFERAYKSSNVSYEEVDYIECHATGTPLGDRVELDSMEMFFASPENHSKKNNIPLIGSVKSNLGHMLTNAGMGGMIKVILSLQNGIIPQTIGIEEALTSKNKGISEDNIVSKKLKWPHDKPERVAAASAFGFGGTNAHIIFESTNRKKVNSNSKQKHFPKISEIPIAIVGMEAIFGGCNGLDEFYKTIFDNKQHFRKLPHGRFKGFEKHSELLKNRMGAWLESFDIDFLRFKLQPDPKERLIPQQLLALEVTDRAIKKTKLLKGQNVAVIVAMETELEIHRFRGRVNLASQIEESLKNSGVFLSDDEQEKLISISKDSLLEEVQINRFTSFIGNLMAARVSSLWDFSGPAFTVSSEENSVYRALDIAKMFLAEGNINSVVVTAVDLAGSPENIFIRQRKNPINSSKSTLSFDKDVNGWMIGEGAGTVVLKNLEDAKKDNEQIYAILDAVEFSNEKSAISVENAGKKALKKANLNSNEIGILEVFASGNKDEDKEEILGLGNLYSGDKLTCAISGTKAHFGHTFAASGIVSLIKTALCLHHRFIPGVPNWSLPKKELQSENSFYIPVESRPWLIKPGIKKRSAAISGLGGDDVCSHLILSEAKINSRKKIEVSESLELSLFHVSGQDMNEVNNNLLELEKNLQLENEIYNLAYKNFENSKNFDSKFCAVLMGNTREELQKEIESAKSGIESSFFGKGDWISPLGSYFTALPLARENKVAFTYPGGFNSYVENGCSLFQMFPGLHDLDEKYFKETGPKDKRTGSNYLCELLQEELIYPRTLGKLSDEEKESLQEDLVQNPIAMFESGVSSAVLNTHVMRKGFGLEPNIAFGYSMGEISMLYGLGVWESMSNMSDVLKNSSLFKDRLAGPMNAVREEWGLSNEEYTDKSLWGCYSVRQSYEIVKEIVEKEPHVYLILINTPEEVVIAGEPYACERVINKLECPIHPIPVNDVVHCEPVKKEYKEIKKIHTDLVVEHPKIDFFSAIDYGKTKLDSETLSNNIATIYGKTVDYSRLVESVYEDGARIFVDLGPRTTCSNWIKKILNKRDHFSIGVNRKGIDSRTSILQALSGLISHRVPIDLELLFPEISLKSSKKLVQTIELGGKSVKEVFEQSSLKLNIKDIKHEALEISGMKNSKSIYQSENLNTISEIRDAKNSIRQFEQDSSFFELFDEFGSSRNNAHSAFLDARQQGLRQLSGVISNLINLDYPYINEQLRLKIKNKKEEIPIQRIKKDKHAIFDYQDLLELAGGKISNVFGPEYEKIDSYKRYVRLPMEPYLLVSRVTEIKGKLGEFKPSTITTEYDIPENAWYTTDGQIPWAVAVESGQCDLMLISFLGIDFQCKGEKVYRLLDCTLTYLEDMPLEGQTLRYEISINSFAKHDQNLLFFFNYECFVGNKMVLRMDGGCAGFFSDEDLSKGRGVVQTKEELNIKQNAKKIFFPPLLNCSKTSFSRQELLEISYGNPAGCFGSEYRQDGKNLSLKNAPDKFLMSDRIVSVDTRGGHFGLGFIIAEKDLSPEDWYFPCHFKDDPVLAGSLMAEGCVQLLQFFLLYLGLQTLVKDATFQPIHDLPQIVRCRGQVIPGDSKITYHLEVKEIGLEPNPYAIADIDILLDGKIVVDFRNLGVQLAEKNRSHRVTKSKRKSYHIGISEKLDDKTKELKTERNLIADEKMIWEFALGDVQKCFGSDFSNYEGRLVQRNPNKDLCLISRVYDFVGNRMEFEKPMSIVSEYDVPEDAWYFKENSHPSHMPYSILMEIALQPCGFISTHSGAILMLPEADLHYRNLDGNGTLIKSLDLRGRTIVNNVDLISTVISGDTIIQNHRFSLSCDGEKFYDGSTVFGYFTDEALLNQVGLDSGKKVVPWIIENNQEKSISLNLNSIEFSNTWGKKSGNSHFYICEGQLSFSDEIIVLPTGGKYKNGYAYARKDVDTEDWFFPCHFFQDPVMPGSLGIEAIIQALQCIAIQNELGASFKNPRFSPVLSTVSWKYRGQIIPKNKYMQLDVHVKKIEKKEQTITLYADANLWREELRIYEISDIVLGIEESE